MIRLKHFCKVRMPMPSYSDNAVIEQIFGSFKALSIVLIWFARIPIFFLSNWDINIHRSWNLLYNSSGAAGSYSYISIGIKHFSRYECIISNTSILSNPPLCVPNSGKAIEVIPFSSYVSTNFWRPASRYSVLLGYFQWSFGGQNGDKRRQKSVL